MSANREAELLSVINSLKSALEKSSASTVPMSKYMQELAKRKEVQRQCADAGKQLAEAKQLVSFSLACECMWVHVAAHSTGSTPVCVSSTRNCSKREKHPHANGRAEQSHHQA